MLPLKYVYTHVASLGGEDSISTDTAKTQNSYATKDTSSAFRLINVDHVQVLLLAAWGTSASSANLSLAGKDFKISRIKYRAPMLYDAERSQL